MPNNPLLTLVLTLFTLIAFAANSILCRLALASGSIGEFEFTAVRLLSGTLILLPILLLYRPKNGSPDNGARAKVLAIERSNTAPSLALFAYALFFSLAYVQLPTGTGALILFAAVQITMVGFSIFRGNHLTMFEWLGFVLALSGLIYLISPGLSAPPLGGAVLMLISGFSWGCYSLLGQGQRYPVLSTSRNFLFTIPGCILLIAVVVLDPPAGSYTLSTGGLGLAVMSGAVASAMGYILWYLTLKRITTTVASIVQLAVPVIAALGGILFLGENLSLRLVWAAVLIIGGIVVTVWGGRL